MKQVLHVLIVNAECNRALVRWVGGRWMLPIVSAPEHVRAAPLVLHWLARRSLPAEFAGQWLGRAAPGLAGVDWLAAVRARLRQPLHLTDLQWTPLRALTSSAACADYQQWAVAKATTVDGCLSVPGPFGSPAWIEELDAWLSMVKPAAAADALSTTPHRVTAWEVVLEIRAVHQSWFVKGLSPERAREARLTIQLAQVAPDSFPRTRALAQRPDGSVWWLMDACPGSTLTRTATLEQTSRVAAALARLQHEVVRHLAPDCSLDLPAIELAALARWGAELLIEQRNPPGGGASQLEDDCRSVTESQYPDSWVATDLDPTNLLVDGDSIRFIDLDGSVLAPAAVSAAVLARRFERHGIGAAAALYSAYERGWPQPLDVRGHRRELEIASILLEGYLAWQRVIAKTEQGEIHDLLNPLRSILARRIADQLHVVCATPAHFS